MKLNDMLGRMVGWYLAGVSVHIKSSPGRGKSTTIERFPQIAEEAFPGKKFGIVIINGGMLTPMDVLGYGVPVHLDGHSEMKFTEPFFWRTREGKRLEEYDGGIIYVDEADKMDVDTKKVVGEGRLSGRFGPHKLPDGWLVWSSGNLESDRSGSTKDLDHEINRRMDVSVQDDTDSLLEFGRKNGVMPLTLAFIEQNPQVVFTPGVPKEQGPWMTPRSLFRLDSYLQTLARLGNGRVPDDDKTQEEAAGLVGHAAKNAYFAFIKLEREMPKFEDILKDPQKAHLPDATAPDARMLVCYQLAYKVSKETIAPVIEYIKRMPSSFATTFAKTACDRDPLLIMTPSMDAWTQDNASLMFALSTFRK